MEENTQSKTSPDEWMKKKLLPIMAITTFLGVIMGAMESISKFLKLAESNFYLLNTLLWLVFLIILVQIDFGKLRIGKLNGRPLKIVSLILTTLIFLFSVSWKYYELHIRKTKPAEQPSINLSETESRYPIIFFASTQSQVDPGFQIEEMYINEKLCSFMETQEIIGSKKYRQFIFNNKLHDAFLQGKCFGVYGDEPAKKALPILRERLDKMSKSSLKAYINSVQDLSRIIRERGDIFNQIMFSNEELETLKTSNLQQYEVIKDWILNCIGVNQPVITFTLKSTSDEDLLINKVIYDVSFVFQVMGGESGPLYPVITYSHVLNHKKGLQKYQLIPPLTLKAHDRVSFNIRLISSSSESGLGWTLKVRFYDVTGRNVETEPFELIMSK